MALETKHAEKMALFKLLKVQRKDSGLEQAPASIKQELKEATLELMAIMEQDDVKLVQKYIAEL